jgi:hypothetical protein
LRTIENYGAEKGKGKIATQEGRFWNLLVVASQTSSQDGRIYKDCRLKQEIKYFKQDLKFSQQWL